MGCGIAQAFGMAGFNVVLQDVCNEALAKAKDTITQSLHKLGLSPIKSILFTPSTKDLKDCDLIIEAVPEQIDIKIQTFQYLLPYLSPRTILASNTSSISITQMGRLTDRPERFIGMHFMNPVPLMNLVEIIPGDSTSPEIIQIIQDLTKALGKTSVLSKDSPGFITNRILMPMINEAIYAYHEGIASLEDIDMAMKLGLNHPMGPLRLADFIGLDTCFYIMTILHQGFQNPKYLPCPLLEQYVKSGRLGRKSGQGFYDYP